MIGPETNNGSDREHHARGRHHLYTPGALAGLIKIEHIAYKEIDWYTGSTVVGPHGPGNPPLHSFF